MTDQSTNQPTLAPAPDRVIAAAVSTAAVLGATLAGSHWNPVDRRTRRWYGRLDKPGYTPPKPAYGAVWSVLGVSLAYAGYRLLARRRELAAAAPISAWGATVTGLVAFPALFFGARSTAGGAVASAAMCASAATTAATARRLDPAASAAMLPLAVWTGFATLLSEEIWRRN